MTYRFGVFEFESDSGELRKAGRPVALEPQPARALAVLLARADHLVTRDELKAAVWDKDTHVDFDRGLAYCISQIRTALGDAGDSPRFIQTIPKKGYRFIAPVHAPAHIPDTPDVFERDRSTPAEPIAASKSPAHSEPTAKPAAPLPPGDKGPPARTLTSVMLLAALLLCAGVVAAIALRGRGETSDRAVIAVSIFDNETGRAEYDRLVSGLSDLVVTRLTELAPDRVAVIGNAAVLRQPRNIRNLKAVATGVRADYVLLGQLQHADPGLRFITHFIRLSDETHLRANRLSFPSGDLTSLEQQVVAEFERALQTHVLSGPAR